MAFPVVEGRANSIESSAVTSHSVALPTGIVSGERLVIFFFHSVTANSTNLPSGWTERIRVNTVEGSTLVCERIADGTEGATQTVTTSGGSRSVHRSWRISGSDTATALEFSTLAEGADANPNPGSLTPSWGAADTLWIAICGIDAGRTFSAFPTNYTDTFSQNSATSTNSLHAAQATAERSLNATSEDPGTFTASAADDWIAYTLAIPPTAGAGAQTVSPGLISSVGTTFSPTVSPGAVSVTPGLISSTGATFSPTITATFTLTPGLIDQIGQTFSPSVSPGAVTVTPGLISQAGATFSPTVSQAGGTQTVEPGLISQAGAVFSPTVAAGAVSVTPAPITQTGQVFSATILPGAVTATPGLISQAGVVFSPSVVPGTVTVTPGLITQTGATFSPVVVLATGEQTVTVALIDQAGVVFAPALAFPTSWRGDLHRGSRTRHRDVKGRAGGRDVR